ncbi:hypothetical protein PNU79_10940 [Turicibacter sanguinis]|uniref:hypothetical protein n=1 Tax=Turicibacter sanguinis TaxID=154288 RepID=UPI002330EF46|nr:hypothetical protein [Turicibacter sanguinis]MDB8542516.1 hypothetical protein [Turicibacter sanguinis]
MSASSAVSRKGLFITDVVLNNNNTNLMMTEKKYIHFNIDEIKQYKIYFEELKRLGIFYENFNFDDHKWTGLHEDYNCSLNFEKYRYNIKIYLSLKFYILIILYFNKVTLLEASLALAEILRCIEVTHNFRGDCLIYFESYLDEKNSAAQAETKRYITPYLLFIEVDDELDEYFIELSTIQYKRNSNVRKLPSYKSIVNFDFIINDFLLHAEQQELLKYYPVILWWRITSVIPLRPNEFLKLRANCCYQKNDSTDYYLQVPRSKIRPNILSRHAVVEIVDELKVVEDIYNLIQYFKDMLELSDEKYLFAHKSFLNISHRKYDLEHRTNKYKVNQKDFRNLLVDFYKTIIEGQYGYHPIQKGELSNSEKCIEMLQPGDTRHLAFCSMMLQGFNPLTMAQMGGHQTLTAQNHYVNHLEEFSDAQTLMLSNYLKMHLKSSSENLNDVLLSNDKRKLAFKKFDSPNFRLIENGKCYSANFPRECIKLSCLFCKYFEIDWTNVDKVEISKMKNQYKEIDCEIKVKINLLKHLYYEMHKPTRDYKERFVSNEVRMKDVKREIASINDLIGQRAILNAYIEVSMGE